MRQFDVFENPSRRSRPIAPYIVVLQSHLLAAAPTVVAAPLIRDDRRSNYSAISVVASFRGESFIVVIPELAALDPILLRRPIGNLREHEDAIRRALDRLFTGF
ncbi:MAG: CcdB family protein [Phenylobacterium sp.]|nr:CcdB family protein [Phenylobacterium sp.]